MTSSIDSNVIVALWDKDRQNTAAMQTLYEAFGKGRVVVGGAVYAELLGGYGRSREMLDEFFEEAGIEIEWGMDRETWELAGTAYQGYVSRRRRRKGGVPRRMLTDFMVGAHAVRHGHTLVTQDKGIFRAAFPKLEIVYA